jgi:transposase
MNPYSSSLNDAEWAVVEALLTELLPTKKQTCPHKWGNRLLFDAMLYQLKNGCHWADLPKDFPSYSTVYWHYKQWRALGIIDKLMSRLHESQRKRLKKTIHKPRACYQLSFNRK